MSRRIDARAVAAATDLPALASSYRSLQKAGSGYRAKCIAPEHEDRNPSMGLFIGHDGEWRFKCHSCGVSGDSITFYQLATNATFQEALKALSGVADPGLLDAPVARLKPREKTLIDGLKAWSREQFEAALLRAKKADMAVLVATDAYEEAVKVHGLEHWLTDRSAVALAAAHNEQVTADYRFEVMFTASARGSTLTELARLYAGGVADAA